MDIVITILVILEIFLVFMLISIVLLIKNLNKQFICEKCGARYKVLPNKCDKCKNKMPKPTFYKTMLFGRRNSLDNETHLLSSSKTNFWVSLDIIILLCGIAIIGYIIYRLV